MAQSTTLLLAGSGIRVAWLALGLFVGACAPSYTYRTAQPHAPVAPPVAPGFASPNFIAVRFSDLPDWQADQHAAALATLRRSCAKLASQPPEQQFGWNELFGRFAHWQRVCAEASVVSPEDSSARAFFEQQFVPFRVETGNAQGGLFTGYYEPVLRGSWFRTGRFSVPVYRPPPEVAAGMARSNGRGVTLPSRAQIEAGALAGRGLELLWLDDPIAAFFLHIQGSGQVEMRDGTRVRIGYAGKNGHAYMPIGAELIRRGEIAQEEMSMQAIRAWLIAHPQEGRKLMAMNPSFVFFRLVNGEGPIGAQGVPLLPGRSVAVDPSFVPYGVPLWMDTTDPLAGSPLRRLVVAQDTGAAIKGAVRGDLFWGSGEEAAAGAGLMRQPGQWFFLLPKAAVATS